jgi:hypothetical protein
MLLWLLMWPPYDEFKPSSFCWSASRMAAWGGDDSQDHGGSVNGGSCSSHGSIITFSLLMLPQQYASATSLAVALPLKSAESGALPPSSPLQVQSLSFVLLLLLLLLLSPMLLLSWLLLLPDFVGHC